MTRIWQWFKGVLVFALLFVPLHGLPVAQAAPPADESIDAQIANAESAAISVIAQDATIYGWDADGMATVLLREGTNGWTCVPDWPASPVNDPQCSDPIWTAFMDAYAAGTDPVIDGVGLSYMLMGGADPSASDPFAPIPAEGEPWVESPAHLMILMPGGFDPASFPTEATPDAPYIMWAGTPYEHLMVPVVPMPDDEMGDVSADQKNTMGAAPMGIAKGATITGNPVEEGGDPVVLQEGTNGWTCYADWLLSPGNDPGCYEPIMDAGFANGTALEVPSLGLSYMLRGGSDPSATDPTVIPETAEEWVNSPAHIMLMVPGGFDAAYYNQDHATGYPYIMWDGTDVEHLMVPVADWPAPAAQDSRNTVIALEAASNAHAVTGDAAAFQDGMSEDFLYISADAQIMGRDGFLAAVFDDALTILDVTPQAAMQAVVLSPESVLVHYPVNFHAIYDGNEFTDRVYVSSIWAVRNGEWKNVVLQETNRPDDELSEVELQIANAESAAISVIGQHATIYGWDADGMATILLRQGTNGWTCVPDWPASPVNDPQCSDPIWTAFMDAYAAGEEPVIDGVGISYMLQGGADPSDTDPFAPIPAEGEPWVESPAHLMLLMPGGFDPASFPTEAASDQPYIMWAGTPYEHLMVPVVPMPDDEMGDISADQKNTMGAAPTGIAKYATIMGDPAEEGGDPVVLQEGTNGWNCGPDWLVSPGNDPGCYEPIMAAAFENGTAQDVPSLGLSYMLRGGSDPSATDPTIIPDTAEEWVNSPAHIMLMVPGGFDAAYYNQDHATGYPYIMWDGTDVEHLMVPVAEWEDTETGN